MKYSVQKIKNGVLLKVEDPEDPKYCWQEIFADSDEAADFEAFAAFLREILSDWGPADCGRYSKYRIFVSLSHGDKYTCPDKPCEYCDIDNYYPKWMSLCHQVSFKCKQFVKRLKIWKLWNRHPQNR